MRRLVVVFVLLAVMPRAHADDASNQPQLAEHRSSRRAKWLAAGSIAAFHGAYLTWQYFAWYRKGDEPFHFEHTGWLGADTYSGGADKLGHLWSNYAMTRATTAVLVAGGWPRLPSSLVSFGLTEVAFVLIEVQDGMAPWGFDTHDLAANITGGLFGLAMANVPALDRLLDLRLQYWPSPQYRRNFEQTHDLDGAQDYTGQSFMLALHLGALPGTQSDWLYWTHFVDAAVGLEARHYVPVPDDTPRYQRFYAGLSLNMQGVLQHLFRNSRGRRIGEGVFEAYSLPYTTFRYLETSRSP